MTSPDHVEAVDFDAFVTARIGALSRTAYLLTGSHHDAEDLVQTALFRAARSWHRIEDDPEPYVRRILYNENVSRWRRRRVAEFSTSTVPERPAAGTDLDTRLVLQRALQSLTPRQRTMVVLRFFEDLTEQRTAALMGVSVSTVKSETRRALARLSQLAPELGPLGPDSPAPTVAAPKPGRRART
jgi:RNA polymerase sigma-70 factor (sigma-E family)